MAPFKTTFYFSILIVALLLGATENSFAKHGGGSGQDLSAIYIVPVSQSDLLKYAIFSGVEVEYKVVSGNNIKIEYSLPLELTGVENKLELVGEKNQDGSVILKGYAGSGDCSAAVLLGRCEMTYSNIEFDDKIRRQILSTMTNGNEVEFEKRLQVANEFEALVTGQGLGEKINPLELKQSQTNPFLPSFFRGDSEIHGILEIIHY